MDLLIFGMIIDFSPKLYFAPSQHRGQGYGQRNLY